MKQAKKTIHGDGAHDDTSGIQALLDSGVSLVYLPPPKKEYLISRTLLIHSQQALRLDPYSGIRLAPQKDRNYSAMIANADQEEGNGNISVTGGIWDMDNMRQPINPVNSGEFGVANGRYRRDFVRAIMDFNNVRHLALKDLILKNASQLHIRMGKVSHFTISDIRIDTAQAPTLHGGRGVGIDGIGLYDGDCHWGFISNIQGKTIDDFISINPDNGPFTKCRGPVENIDISGIHVSGQNSSGIRLLSSGSPIRNIRIRNFNTASAFNVLQLSNFKTFVDFYPNDAHGVFENISLENVTISSPDGSSSNNRPEAALIWIESGGQVSNLSLKNICRTETTRSSELVHVDHGAEVDWLNIDDVYYHNNADKMLPLLTNSGRIRHLTLQNAHINSKPNAFCS